MFLAHAAALLAVGLVGGRWMRLAAYVLLAGLVAFSGDLLARDYLGSRLFPLAAPTGGILMIGGWLLIAAAAVIDRR